MKTERLYMTLYVMFHGNIGHSMHRVLDISSNRPQRPKLDLSDLSNHLWSYSTPFIFKDRIRLTPKNIHEAINLAALCYY